MHRIDFLDILPAHYDKFANERAKRRYEAARSIDWLDVGTELGKHKAMHNIDFLHILPKGMDEHSRRRSSMWKDIADGHRSLRDKIADDHIALREKIDVLEIVPTITDKDRRY